MARKMPPGSHQLMYIIVSADGTSVRVKALTLHPNIADAAPGFLGATMRVASGIPIRDCEAYVCLEPRSDAAIADEHAALRAVQETGSLPIRTAVQMEALRPVLVNMATPGMSLREMAAQNPVWVVIPTSVPPAAIQNLIMRGAMLNSPAFDCLAFLGEHIAHTSCPACTSCPCSGDESRAPGVVFTCPAGYSNTGARGLTPVVFV